MQAKEHVSIVTQKNMQRNYNVNKLIYEHRNTKKTCKEITM